MSGRINARGFLKQAAVCAALLPIPALLPGVARAADGDRPNFILCMTDDQGWGDVSYNEQGRLARGAFKTTELDQMAAAGLRFDRFYAAAAWFARL